MKLLLIMTMSLVLTEPAQMKARKRCVIFSVNAGAMPRCDRPKADISFAQRRGEIMFLVMYVLAHPTHLSGMLRQIEFVRLEQYRQFSITLLFHLEELLHVFGELLR